MYTEYTIAPWSPHTHSLATSRRHHSCEHWRGSSAPTKQRISNIEIQRNVASNIASVWADSHTIVEKIYGWVQEMEPPARGGTALVLGKQADVLQEPEGPDLGSLQYARGPQVWSVLEW